MSIKNITSGQNKFGDELKRIRKERGLTLKELEKRLKISHSYIARIEKGEREPSGLVKETLEVSITAVPWGNCLAQQTTGSVAVLKKFTSLA